MRPSTDGPASHGRARRTPRARRSRTRIGLRPPPARPAAPETRSPRPGRIVLERAAAAEQGKGSILEALGRAYYNSGQYDRSRVTFEALLELDPSADYAHFALGQSLKQLGRRAEARTHLKLAVALAPRSELYRAALDRLGPTDG